MQFIVWQPTYRNGRHEGDYLIGTFSFEDLFLRCWFLLHRIYLGFYWRLSEAHNRGKVRRAG